MKTIASKYAIYVLSLLFIMSASTSCVSTYVEANPYDDSAVNLPCKTKSSWSYFWGLKQKTVSANPEIAGTECACAEKAMTWVRSKTSFWDFGLSLITLGTVNHRTVSYGCARPSGDGGLDG